MFFATLDRDDLRAITEAIREGFRGVKISGGAGTVTTGGGGGGTGGDGDSGDTDVSGSKIKGEGLLDAAKKLGSDIGNTMSSNLKIDFGSILNKFDELQGYAKNIYKEFGGTRELTGEINKSLGQSRYEIIQMGGELKDSYELLQSIAEGTGRNFLSAAESVDDIFAITQITDVYPKELIKGFDQVGVSMNRVGKETMGVVNIAAGMGVNVQETSQKVVENLGKLNLYNFENGVQGLAKMAAKATMFKMDMNNTLKLADDLLSPEKAIEMAAGLQRLGVASSDLIDPLRLMDLAQNDPEELQNQLIELSKQFTYFDEKTKTIKILPGAQRTLRELSGLVGMSAQELANLGIQAGTAERKLSQLSFPAIKMSEDQKNLVSNLAEMNTDGTEYVIKGVFKDEKGNAIEKALDQLTASDMKQLEEYQKQQTRYQDPIELAKDQLKATERVAKAMESYQGRTVVEIASTEAIDRVANLSVKTAEFGLKSAEKLYEKVFTEKSISEVIDEKVNSLFKEGASLAQIQKELSSTLAEYTPKVLTKLEELSKLDFKEMLEKGKEVFVKFGTDTMEAMKEAALEMLKNTVSKDVETFLKNIVTETNKTLESFPKKMEGGTTEDKSIGTTTKPPSVNVENKSTVGQEIGDGEIINVTNNYITEFRVIPRDTDSMRVGTDGNMLIGTDLLNIKTVIDELGLMMRDLVGKIGGSEPSSSNIKVNLETEINNIRLKLEEKSIELINNQIKDQIIGEKQIELKPEQNEELQNIIKKLEEPLNQLVTFSTDQNKVNVDVIPNTALLIEELSKQYTKTIDIKADTTNLKIDSNISEVSENIMNSIKEIQDNLNVEQNIKITDDGSIEVINKEFGLLHENFDKIVKMASEFKKTLNTDLGEKNIVYNSNLSEIKKEIESLPDKKEIDILVNEKWKDTLESSMNEPLNPLVLDVTTKTIDPTKDLPKEISLDTKISDDNIKDFINQTLDPIQNTPITIGANLDMTQGQQELEEFKGKTESEEVTQTVRTIREKNIPDLELSPISQTIVPNVEKETSIEKVKNFFTDLFQKETKSIPVDLKVNDKNLTEVENKKRTAEIKYSAIEDLEDNKLKNDQKINVQYLIDEKSYNDILSSFKNPIHFELIANTDTKKIDEIKGYASKSAEFKFSMSENTELSNILSKEKFDKQISFSSNQTELDEMYEKITSKRIEQFIDLKITNPDVLKNLTEMRVNVNYIPLNTDKIFLGDEFTKQSVNVNYKTDTKEVREEKSFLSKDIQPKFEFDRTKMSDYKLKTMEDIQELITSMTQLNVETGKMEFKPGANRLIEDMSKTIGDTTDNIKKMILQAGEFENKMNKIELTNLNIPDSYKETLAQLSTINEKGEVVVKMQDERGQQNERSIESLSIADINQLMENMNKNMTSPIIKETEKKAPIYPEPRTETISERPKGFMEYMPMIGLNPLEISVKQPEVVVETPVIANEPARRLEERVTTTNTTQNNNVNLGGEATIKHKIEITAPAGLDTNTFNQAMSQYLQNPTMSNQIRVAMAQIKNQYGIAGISKPMGSQAENP